MRRGPACAVAICLLLAGCGGGSEPTVTPRVTATGTAPPAPTPPALAYASGAREALRGGAVAVADFTYRVSVAPSKMNVNREQRLSGLRWSAWGGATTSARGHVTTLICEPNCAQGTLQESTAQLVLSAPKSCRGGRFYTRASMTYKDPETGKTRAPATYLRTPDC
jgi:hypothetical protein